MEIPAGCQGPYSPNLVCMLLRALYGLKPAHWQWYAKTLEFLANELVIKSYPHEPCLCVKHSEDSMMVITLYLDDLPIAGDNDSDLQQHKDQFCKRFKIQDIGEADEFLGLPITGNRPGGT